MWLGCSRTEGLRPDPRFGQEQAQPPGIAGDEGKRLNGNYFSYFPGVVNRLLGQSYLPFRNLWSLFWSIMPESAERVQANGKHWQALCKNGAGLNRLERIWR
jgi:hypothetical protein